MTAAPPWHPETRGWRQIPATHHGGEPLPKRDLLHRIAAEAGGVEPITRLAVELADHLATRPVCRPRTTCACPGGMSLNHAFAGKRLEVLATKTARERTPGVSTWG